MHTEDNYGSEETRKLIEEKIGVRTMPEERVDEILASIEGMEVELAEDPIRRGPRFLIKQIARVRNYMSEVQNYREELQNHITRLKRRLNDLTSEYDLRFNAIRIKNEDIQNFGASKDRDAACEYLLQDLKVDIDTLRSEISELESVLEAVNHRFENLKQTGWDIRKQRELIEDELKLTNSEWNETQDLEEEISEEDVQLSEDDVSDSVEADADRAATPENDVSMDDLVEGVDMTDDSDMMKGPDLGTSPNEDESSLDEDEISEILEDQDFDL